MNSVITIYQDYYNKIDDYKDHLHNLLALRDIVSHNNFSLQVDGTIQIKNYVGFFQKNNTSIQILPKIFAKSYSPDSQTSEVDLSLDFVYRLLYWSGFLSHKKLSPQSIKDYKSDLLEIFIAIFINEFIILYSKNINRRYEQYEENQHFIRGKILFSETIRRNPILRHLHYVRYDDFTVNNPMNQIFKALILKLLKRTKSLENKKNLVIGLTFLQDVELKNLNLAIFNQVQFDRLNTQYEKLFNLARLFFHNLQPGLSIGKENTFSFLVPIHLLFENFVAKIIKSLSDEHFIFEYHKQNLYLGYLGTKQVFQLEPDFTIIRNEKFITILDTKYKYPFDKYGQIKIDTDDLYQLSTYAIRYNCKNLVIIYPKFLGINTGNNILAEYLLDTALGEIKLKIVQIDIMEKDITKLSMDLEKNIYPVDEFESVQQEKRLVPRLV